MKKIGNCSASAWLDRYENWAKGIGILQKRLMLFAANRNVWMKILSVCLAGTLVLGMVGGLTGCGKRTKDQPVTLTVFSQLTNFSGVQSGWIADILKEKFNAKLKIVPDKDGELQKRVASDDLGDIILWGDDEESYADAIQNGLLYDWNRDELLKKEAPYIYANMKDALKRNSELTRQITEGQSEICYGIGNNIATSNSDHQAFIYMWDIRWDVYKALKYPKIKSLKDFEALLVKMQKKCPKDDFGNKTYAVSMWPDWDKDDCMYVRSTAAAFYGYDELGIGLYDPESGAYYDAMMENGPYLELLEFYNRLYRKGLLDPESIMQSYDKMIEKVKNGSVLFSLFNYSGSLAYNTSYHTDKGQFMGSMAPENACPLVKGMSTAGGDYKTCIGAKTKYPELCMKILNYFATPEGHMVYRYGPKGLCWNYDKEKNTYFTKLGLACQEEEDTMMEGKYSGTFHDGICQAAFSSWADDAENPDSNGETYNCDSWKSNQKTSENAMEEEWKAYNQCTSVSEYFEHRTKKNGEKNYRISPETAFEPAERDNDLEKIWSKVTTRIKNDSWKAIYADSHREFSKIVKSTRKETKECGYEKCLKWAKEQAAERYRIEQESHGGKG